MKQYTYSRLPDDEYYAAVTDFKWAAGKLISQLFPNYGYKEIHPIAVDELVELAEQLGMRLRGKTQPIGLKEDYTCYNADD
jgi:hypothetical protein